MEILNFCSAFSHVFVHITSWQNNGTWTIACLTLPAQLVLHSKSILKLCWTLAMVKKHIFFIFSPLLHSNTLDIPFIFLLPGMKTMRKIVMHYHLTMVERKGCCEFGAISWYSFIYSRVIIPFFSRKKI